MVTKIIACSDIHIPSLKGIDELKETLTVFIEKCKKIVKDEMENAVCLDVNLDVDLNIGDSWYDTKQVFYDYIIN